MLEEFFTHTKKDSRSPFLLTQNKYEQAAWRVLFSCFFVYVDTVRLKRGYVNNCFPCLVLLFCTKTRYLLGRPLLASCFCLLRCMLRLDEQCGLLFLPHCFWFPPQSWFRQRQGDHAVSCCPVCVSGAQVLCKCRHALGGSVWPVLLKEDCLITSWNGRASGRKRNAAPASKTTGHMLTLCNLPALYNVYRNCM